MPSRNASMRCMLHRAIARCFPLLVAAQAFAAPATQPATRPVAYCGLALRDEDGSKRTLVKLISPGPLEGHGFSSPHLMRGDTIISVNGAPMNAAEFEALVARSSVGDEINLRVKRTGSDRLTAVPEAAAAGAEEELKFRLADAGKWWGPIHTPHELAAPLRLDVSEAPSPLEAFVTKQLEQQQLAEPVAKLSNLLATTQRKFGGYNALPRIAWGFEHPLRLASLQRAITGPLPLVVGDPRLILNEAAENLDVPRPARLSDPPDFHDPQATVDWLARQLDLADADVTRAFASIDPATRDDSPKALAEMFGLLAKPESIDSSDRPQRFIRAMQASTKIDYGALLDGAGELAGLMRATALPIAAPTTATT